MAAAACGPLDWKHRGHDLLRRLKLQSPQLAPGFVRAHVQLKEALRPGYGEATLPFLHIAGWRELC